MLDVTASFDDIVAAVDRGESLPVSWYTDPAFTDLELEKIFRRTWQYIGPLRDLANTGDYISGFCGNVPVAAVRGESGLVGLVNVCRHRRHQVMKGRGNAKMLQCGYHAWTYDLTGCLKGAPRSQSEPDFNLDDYPLLPARAEALGPWVFVNLDLNARPLSYYFGDVLGMLAQSGLDLNTLQLWEREEWHARANWKTMLENFLECYHCAVAHPSFSAAIDVRPENYALTTYDWVLSQVGNVRQSALEGKSAVKIYDVHGSLAQAQYHLLWPNFTISINPGVPNLAIDVWIPDGPNTCKGFSEHYFGPGVTRQQAEQMIAFNAEVGGEDDELTNSVQLGLISGLPEKGRFLTRAEHLAVDFLKLVAGAMTGRHDEAPGADAERNAYAELEVVKVEPESDEITSFYLRRADGSALAPWIAGQFLPIRLNVPGQEKPVVRTYTISTPPNTDHYRLSIKRMEGKAVSSNFFHDHVAAGSRIEAMPPRGKFVLDPSSERPIVLLSGGVGITPMMAFADALLERGRASGTFRPITFIHQARHGRAAAFGKHLRAAAAEHPSLRMHVCFSEPCESDVAGVTHESTGRVDAKLVASLVDVAECDFYLCGPPAFMQSLYDGLIEKGVGADRIHFESFGAATVRMQQPRAATPAAAGTATSAIPVRFAKSGVDAVWTRDTGTLLELAEASGLAPVFGCRSGICGTCTTRIDSGGVDYVTDPLAPCEGNEVLICSSVPRSSRNPDGEELGIVLDA